MTIKVILIEALHVWYLDVIQTIVFLIIQGYFLLNYWQDTLCSST